MAVVDGLGRRSIPVLAVAIAVLLVSGVTAVVTRGADDQIADGRAGGGTAAGAEELPEVVGFDCGPWDALASQPAPRTPDLTPLAPDPDLRQGRLENGLRYYVRSNTRPGQSASLALAVDAGAAVEDDDQHGAAHYLEHMLFNGTEAFPGDELPDVLRELGVQLGADLNAFTNEDATVYHLHLANDESSLDRGLDVLLEWATRATLTPDDTEAERGVILEELRATLGPDGRSYDRVRDLSLEGTRYAGHEVIGTEESVRAMTPESLRRFYEDWYRPDMVSVVAVGDFDAAAVEAKIRDRFAPVAAPTDPRARPALDSEPPSGPRFSSYIDDEITETSAEVVFTRPSEPLTTMEDLRRQVVRDVGMLALGQRLNDDADRGLVPFYDVEVEMFRPVHEFESLLLSLGAEPERLGESLESMVLELARVRRHGLTESEVASAVAVRRSHSLATQAGVSSTQDRELLSRFVDAALADAPTTPSDVGAQAELTILDGITAADVAEELGRITTCGDMAVQAGVPGAYEEWLPGEDEIAAMITEATSGDLRPRPPEPDAPAAIMATPEPVAPVFRQPSHVFDPLMTFGYPNGARVVVIPNDIAAGRVTVVGESLGGLAEVEPGDLSNARAAARLVSESGVGDVDSVTLQRMLAARDAYASTEIGPHYEAVEAGGAAGDLETILQLVHQRMTNPRIDDSAVATYRGEHRLLAEDPHRRADTALTAAVDELARHDDGRLRQLTTEADLAALDPARALALHRDRFGDAADFVFVIVGDVDSAVAEDLANRYLGSLPGAGRVDDGAYTPPPPPASVVTRRVEAGTAPQAAIEVVFEVQEDVTPQLRDIAGVLEAVLDNRLRVRLREELGASYVPTVSVEPDQHTDRIRTSIEVGSDPQRIDEVAREIQAVIAGMRDPGPTDEEVARALEPMLRDLEYIDHQTIVTTLVYAIRHQDISSAPITAGSRIRVGSTQIRQLAQRLLPAGAYVEVVQVPAGG